VRCDHDVGESQERVVLGRGLRVRDVETGCKDGARFQGGPRARIPWRPKPLPPTIAPYSELRESRWVAIANRFLTGETAGRASSTAQCGARRPPTALRLGLSRPPSSSAWNPASSHQAGPGNATLRSIGKLAAPRSIVYTRCEKAIGIRFQR
jgi:hypothetical protein